MVSSLKKWRSLGDMTQAFTRMDKKSNVIVISHRNHDAEALEINAFSLSKKGNAVITI